MSKRSSENQLTKDEYEGEDDESGQAAPTGSFEHASDNVLKKRRIVRGAGGSGGMWAASAPSSSSSSTRNPFAAVQLSSSTTTSADTAAAKSAPFVSFASSVPSSASTNAMMTAASTTTTTSSSNTSSSSLYDTQLAKLNASWKEHLKVLDQSPKADWSDSMCLFREHRLAVESLRSTTTATSPNAQSFSFVAAASPAATAPMRMATTSTPVQQSTTIPTTESPAPKEKDDDDDVDHDDDDVAQVNPDSKFTSFFHCKVKPYVWNDGNWKGRRPGLLRLEYDSSSGTKVLVVRDFASGKPNLNIQLPTDAEVVQLGKSKAIRFLTKVADDDDEPTQVALVTIDPVDLDKLNTAIHELANKAL